MIASGGRSQVDWSGDYRVFSRARFDTAAIFAVAKRHILAQLPPNAPLVVPLDDTKLRKSGPKIPGVSYQRDPMSPPFCTNFIRAQRFLQMSVSLPLDNDQPEAARSFPIAFRHAPPVPRPNRKAPESAHADYRRHQKVENLSCMASQMLRKSRAEFGTPSHDSPPAQCNRYPTSRLGHAGFIRQHQY